MVSDRLKAPMVSLQKLQEGVTGNLIFIGPFMDFL